MLKRRVCVALIFCTACVQDGFGLSEYSKYEVGAAASIVGVDTKGAFNNDKSRDGLYGFDIQSAYNISRIWGLKADVSYFQRQFGIGSVDHTTRLFQIMGGIKLQNNETSTRFRPFAEALIGVAHGSRLFRVVQESSSGRLVSDISATGPAFALGGGVDVRLTRRLELRAFEIDYNPMRLRGENFQNVRLVMGLNFRF